MESQTRHLHTRKCSLPCFTVFGLKTTETVKISRNIRARFALTNPNSEETTNAVEMYSNIDTAHCVEIVRKLLQKFKNEGKISEQEYPKELIESLLKLVMENNIIKFGDAHYKQLCGTAMGTLVACVYAYLYSGWKEIHDILPEYDRTTAILPRKIN